MSWRRIAGAALLANAAAHVVSAAQVRGRSGPDQEAGGVAAFAVVYAVLGGSMLAGARWAPRATQVLGLIGMTGLLTSWNEATAPAQTNQAILGLDIVSVATASLAAR